MANNIIGTVGVGAQSTRPDWNQNDPNAKDYIKNRPGGYVIPPSVEIAWDGDTTGKETIVVPNNETLVKIADEAPSIDEFAVGTSYKAIIMTETTYSDGSNETVQKQIDLSYGGDFWIGSSSSPLSMVLGVTVDSVSIDELTFSKGLWFSIADGAEMQKVIACGISTTDGGSKKFPVSSMPDEVLNRIIDAQNMAETAQNTASTAQSTANAAQNRADTAQTTANEAKTAAETAQSAADSAIGADVIKGDYILRTGQQKYAGYGFAILLKGASDSERELSGFYPDCLLFSKGNERTYLSTNRLEIKVDADARNSAVISVASETASGATQIKLKKNTVTTILDNRGVIDCPNNTLEVKGVRGASNKIGSGIILTSETPGSTKRFKITVDDTGTISATEVTT